ncbi:siderophore biosynthesis protein PvsA [Pseudomonas sp. CCI3.2]|uniref:ATP-grasp domain-containing protein n=1 Tax=unclassified Pseudomonas TaxID=196821 RepID=UPI002AC91487|nr:MULTISPECIES: siderophore biosynthesis protein PvsA [unclassified Pseudomonas]MEB0076404.1 siderophore biosynthesis protein PvsA [Pseudomonas sp. MH10out]MEB0091247.1 siderophore biosynthesis protein PvsA [Pseudomonas sp. CCI4.2]MEB0100799.1 siderophore biosynthesis protein PvsA [Pseudomonas sp. CCI3.2]MEB0128816.1 siderophore biosynthesis protein PvsA [Pseudomonas sp. CCI2.4]MEB0156957.1 siderophore biosynthesis protein PvsA [Pseudomonas sp. AH2 (2023)]
MQSPLVILSHVPHAAITEGFLTAARARGLPVVLISDHAQEHRRVLAACDTPAHDLQILECDVFNPLAVIELINAHGLRPVAVFSNSDHLQTATALVAEALKVPGKDWRLCYSAKNKAVMRERMLDLGLPGPWFQVLTAGSAVPTDAPFPLVVKPTQGVASLDVRLCNSAHELSDYCNRFWEQQPGRALLLEAYMEGPLFTLETLGDQRRFQAIGGFDVTLSPPPHFVELSARWNGPLSKAHRANALAQVSAFGIQFGVCHSEFILTADGPMLVEINYRSIGDGREFLLDRLLPQGWFDRILGIHLGEKLLDAEPVHAQALVHYVVADTPGRLQQAPASFSDLQDSHWRDYRALREVGDEIQLSHSNKDYLGVLRMISPDATSLDARFAAALDDLRWVMA